MLVGFLLSTFDRGLSTVEVDDPDTSEGVRVVPTASSFGRRDDETCHRVLDTAVLQRTERARTEVGLLPWRDLPASEGFATSPL